MELQKSEVNVPPIPLKNYNGIDLIKFICSIMVFMVHVPFFTENIRGQLSPPLFSANFWIANYFSRLAVPFFFVCSGFFLYKKMPNNEIDVVRVKNYCFKLLFLLGAWNILLFLGKDFHLWYLSATVFAVFFLSVCLYFHMKVKYLMLIACVFYVLGLLGDSYFGLVEPIVSKGVPSLLYRIYSHFITQSRNRSFMAVIFVLIGYLFAQEKIKLKTSVSLVLFILSMIGLCAEVFILDYYDLPADYNMYIFLLPVTTFLFAFASSLTLKDSPIYAKLRTVGVLIYYLHMLILRIVSFGISIFYWLFKVDLFPVRFFLALFVTLLVTFGIEKLARHEKFKWIHWFLS